MLQGSRSTYRPATTSAPTAAPTWTAPTSRSGSKGVRGAPGQCHTWTRHGERGGTWTLQVGNACIPRHSGRKRSFCITTAHWRVLCSRQTTSCSRRGHVGSGRLLRLQGLEILLLLRHQPSGFLLRHGEPWQSFPTFFFALALHTSCMPRQPSRLRPMPAGVL